MHPFTFRQYGEGIALVLIILLAALLRFGWPGVSSFGYDEARLSLIALDWVDNGQFPSLGMPSSAGVPNLPAAAWVFSLPYLISTNPQIATWFAGLLNGLAVIGVWALTRRTWGRTAALTAAIIMASAPYSVLYARSIWAQNLLAPMGLLWAASAYLALSDMNRRALIVHGFIAGFAFQVHFAGAALALGTLVILIRWRPPLLPVLAGGAAAGLCALPFAFELLRTPDLLARFTGAAGNAVIDTQSFSAFAQLAGQQTWGFLAAGRWPGLGNLPELLGILAVVPLLLGLLAIFRARISGTDPQRRLQAELLGIWLACGPIFFLRRSTPVYIHYMLVAMPALAILVGCASILIPKRAWAALCAVCCTACALGWTIQIGAQLEAAQQANWGDGIGTLLQNVQRVANAIPADKPVLLFTHGDDPKLDGEAAAFNVLWWEREHRILAGDSLLVLPNYPATLLATLAPFQAWEELQAAGLATNSVTFVRRGDELPFVATYYDGQAEPQGYTTLETPVTLADGTILVSWRVRQVGPRLRVSTVWYVDAAPVHQTIQQFHHLHTEDTLGGQPFMGSDVPVFAHSWRKGDSLIVMADFFEVPPGLYTLELGRYTLPEIVRFVRMDGSGDAIRLPQFLWDGVQ